MPNGGTITITAKNGSTTIGVDDNGFGYADDTWPTTQPDLLEEGAPADTPPPVSPFQK